jgi:3',5'-cyclic AMP phosphodiesterase CpdA
MGERRAHGRFLMLIAHLSDIHLPPMPPLRLIDASPKRVLGWLNWHARRHRRQRRDVLDRLVADLHLQKPDHIVVTGDLVNIGLPAEHAAALAWLHTVGAPHDVTAIPGNHDVYGWLWRDPGIGRWLPFMSSDEGGCVRLEAQRPDGLHFPFVRQRGRVALIGLSTAVPTPPFSAAGMLGAAQLAELADRLASLGQSGLFRIVLIHHAPLPGQCDRRRGLTDAVALAAVLQAQGAELVLHGHHHRLMQVTLAGPKGNIPILGVPSASSAPEAQVNPHATAAGYHLLRIDPDAAGDRLAACLRTLGSDGHFHSTPITLPE